MPPQAHWLVRVVAQVSFFGLIGQLLDSAETTEFLVVGNAVLLATLGTMFSIASTSWERYAQHYNEHPAAPLIRRRDRLGGLLHEYELAA